MSVDYHGLAMPFYSSVLVCVLVSREFGPPAAGPGRTCAIHSRDRAADTRGRASRARQLEGCSGHGDTPNDRLMTPKSRLPQPFGQPSAVPVSWWPGSEVQVQQIRSFGAGEFSCGSGSAASVGLIVHSHRALGRCPFHVQFPAALLELLPLEVLDVQRLDGGRCSSDGVTIQRKAEYESDESSG